MCWNKIKDFIMGQYNSYKRLSVEREISSLEKEIIKLKTSQRYSVGAVADVAVESAEYSNSKSSDLGYNDPTGEWAYLLIGHVKFEGANKNRVARGDLFYINTEDNSLRRGAEFYAEPNRAGEGDNVYRWSILISSKKKCTYRLRAYMNMPGILTFTSGL